MRQSYHTVFWQGMQSFRKHVGFHFRMNALQMLREFGCNENQGLRGADIDTCGTALAVSLAQIAHQGVVMGVRIKSRDICGTGLAALSTLVSQAPVAVDGHTLFFLIKKYGRRIQGTRLLTLSLFLPALGTDILDRFRQRQQIAKQANA